MTILIKFDGITGSTKTDKFVGCVEVDSYQFGLSIMMDAAVSNKQRVMSKPSISEITFSKRNDVASSVLMQKCVSGTVIPKVDITFAREVDNALLPYIVINLTDVYVSSYSQSSGGDAPSESFSLSFTTIKQVYTEQEAEGKKAGNSPFGWNLAENKAVA